MQRTLNRRERALAWTKKVHDNEFLLGSILVTVAVLALVATTVLYLKPVNTQKVSFETTDASAIANGAGVRVAGVTVGKVTGLTIGRSTVRVDAEIEDNVFVGSESRVEVRMLTPVGGYAVTLIPLGGKPLSAEAIPTDHVSVPYSIGDVLQAAPHVTDHIDGTDINANIAQVAEGLEQHPTSVGSVIAGLKSIATVMDRQRDQIHQIADMAAEYLDTFNGSREFVFELLRQVEIVASTYNNSHAGFDEAYQLLGEILHRVEPFERFYLNHKDEVRAAFEQARTAIGDFQASLGPALDQLQNLRSRLEAWLGPDGLATVGGGTILASGICVPIAGRTC
ncbi:MlaD family protein [Antrihabitans stalactiti]|uniref:MCE family protein n=1 Tax=Antrihabitans stalactiti TaxID=2584121 RepID=A0A848KKB1_9NOCA|nr:MlaD family protein [Antrihabitans stalactiti]NMN96690.1 MCE family protein [Antrihabitans stalactiti]